jgi:hypothetical protein
MFPTVEMLQKVMIDRPNLDHFKKMISSLNKTDINHKVKELDGKTLLHIAAEMGEFDMINALLEKKASIALKDNHGRTPIDVVNQQLEYNMSIEMDPKLRQKYVTSLDILEYVSEMEKRLV